MTELSTSQNQVDENDIYQGKTPDEAIATALSKLGVTQDEVNIEILETGSKGIFGIGAKAAKVAIKVKYDPVKIADKFLKTVCETMKVNVEVKLELKEKKLFIELEGEDSSVFIGKRGQTLDSIQYLTNLVVNKGEDAFVNVHIDTNGYRQKRRKTLERLAYSLSKKARTTKKKVLLEPMSSSERRIIHFALQNDKYVYTSSEGNEPYRKVAIIPKTGDKVKE